MIADLADIEVLNMNRFDTVEKSLSEPDVRRQSSGQKGRRIPNGLLADPNTIRQLALKCDEKLSAAMKTAEENASLREQVAGLKLQLISLQKENEMQCHKECPAWTELLTKSGKLSRRDRVLLVQSMAGQLGMIAQFPRTHFK